MQGGRKAVRSMPYVSVTFFLRLEHNFIAYRFSKVFSRSDCIFDNQVLVGCIPIPAAAIHLNLKS